MQEDHVVLAQIGPLRGIVGEGFLQATVEPSPRARCSRAGAPCGRRAEVGVVEAPLVDHHHDVFGGEALHVDERPHGGTGQAGPEMSDDDGGHTLETTTGVSAQDNSQSAGT